MTTTISDPNDVISTLREVIAGLRPDLDAREIDEHSLLLDDGLGLDSIAIIELISALEERLDFAFEDSDLRTRTFKNVATLAEVIMQRLQNSGSTPPSKDSLLT